MCLAVVWGRVFRWVWEGFEKMSDKFRTSKLSDSSDRSSDKGMPWKLHRVQEVTESFGVYAGRSEAWRRHAYAGRSEAW